MGKLIKVDKQKLKISAEECEKKLREDKVTAWVMKEQDREDEKILKKLKEEK